MNLNKQFTLELKSLIVILIFPLLIIIPAAVAVAIGRVTDSLDQYSTSFIRRVDSIIEELYFEHGQVKDANFDCENFKDELFFDSTYREMFFVKNGIVVCSSRLGSAKADIRHLLGDKGIKTGEYLYNRAGDPSKRTLIVATVDDRDPFSGVFSMIDREYLQTNIGKQISDRVGALRFRVGTQTFPQYDDFSSDKHHVSAKSNHYGYEIIVEAKQSYLEHMISYVVLQGIIVSLLLSTAFVAFRRYFLKGDSLVEDLRRGLDRDELFLMYQPVVDSEDKSVVALEALARWEHPSMGLIGPNVFIPLAEDYGLINKLTSYVLDRVYRDLCGMDDVKVSYVGVNIPPQYLHHAKHIEHLRDTHRSLDALGVTLCVEVTERQLLDDDARNALTTLRGFGIKISIDDFGTGHTALSVLQKTSFDVLKIDKCFIDTIGVDSVNTPVLQTIIELGHRLGVDLVAEGVETYEQVSYLDTASVQYLQGYHFYKPLNLTQLREIL
ncbi:EAL domain-containing protein [Vibrio agarivorans]|uniref:EAL domain-containing protein n=1 Tax=Vibrio agarivorans TaxID=153622 RepID=UPI00222F5A17|nr:EAL domain-containing protein [Vibrio agarivorans]